MNLVPEDPRALTEIESHLVTSDPSLAAMFDVFATDPSRSRESAGQSPSRLRPAAVRPGAPSQRARARRIAVLATVAAFLILSITMAAITLP